MIIKEQDKRKLGKLKCVLKAGGIAILPAFTIYGFSASLFNRYANLKIFRLKKRLFDSPFIVIAQKEFILDSVNSVDRDKLEFLLDNGITVVVETSNKFPSYASKNNYTAFRLANTPLLRYAASSFPITSTSINVSGKKDINNVKEIAKVYASKVDIVVSGKTEKMVSTVVKIQDDNIEVLREGCCIDKIEKIR